MALPKSIGIRLFDDSFVPVLTEGEIKNKKVILTTVKDNQKKAIIKLYEGNSDKCADNEFLGKLVIPINRKTAKGEPGLEVHLRLDDDGMLYAKAWDVESGEQTNIKIEHNETPRIFPETLSDVEIDDLDADSDTKKIDDIGDFDDNNAAEDDSDNNFSFGDEYSEDDNQDFSDNSYNDNYDDNYDDNAENNYANTTYNTEYKEEKSNNTLKGILIGIIIFLLLVLIALGIICGLRACSNTEKKPKPIKPPKTTIQNTTTTYEDYLEEETTTTTVTTTTIYVAPKPETTGVKTLNGKKHYIRRGDNLWNICKKYYGDPWYYPDLAKYNNLRSPRFIIAGQNLIIPDKSELKRWDFSK